MHLIPPLPRALSAALLGLLLAFNAIASVHPVLPDSGGASIGALTSLTPLLAQFREPVAVAKAATARTGLRHDEGASGDPALPPINLAASRPMAGPGAPGAPHVARLAATAATDAYRARAPPFAV